jgi:putative hydrolase of the HAD superfamily
MKKNIPVTTLFVDCGGVLLTNGWDHTSRKLAADTFKLDFAQMDERHRICFDTYESGKMSLDEYLDILVFYQKRSFSKSAFQQFMHEQSQPFPDMISLIQEMKKAYHLQIVMVSNEGRELMDYRIKHFHLRNFIDIFIVSGLVKFKKPDLDIFRLALEVSQANVNEVIYIDDREIFINVAKKLDLRGICHTSMQTTRKALQDVLNK